MILIPEKYPNYRWFMHDWTARMLGGPETLETLWWSRKTYGTDWGVWRVFSVWSEPSGWSVPTVWSVRNVWKDIEDEMSKTTPGVSKPPEPTL